MCILLVLVPRVTVTEFCRLSVLNAESYFRSVPETKRPRRSFWKVWLLLRPLPSACTRPHPSRAVVRVPVSPSVLDLGLPLGHGSLAKGRTSVHAHPSTRRALENAVQPKLQDWEKRPFLIFSEDSRWLREEAGLPGGHRAQHTSLPGGAAAAASTPPAQCCPSARLAAVGPTSWVHLLLLAECPSVLHWWSLRTVVALVLHTPCPQILESLRADGNYVEA